MERAASPAGSQQDAEHLLRARAQQLLALYATMPPETLEQRHIRAFVQRLEAIASAAPVVEIGAAGATVEHRERSAEPRRLHRTA